MGDKEREEMTCSKEHSRGFELWPAVTKAAFLPKVQGPLVPEPLVPITKWLLLPAVLHFQ